MQTIFNQFDTDHSGNITHENIKFAMQKLGNQISDKDIEEMIAKHDTKGDGILSYEEFSQIFRGLAEAEDDGFADESKTNI